MKQISPTIMLLTTAITFNGCGFHPLYTAYGTKKNVNLSALLSQIKVIPIESQLGRTVFNILIDRLTPSHKVHCRQRYELSVHLTQRVRNLSIRKDHTASRTNFVILAEYQIKDLETNTPTAVIFSDRAQTTASYDLLEEQYTAVIIEQAARKQAARYLAEVIVNRLAIFFLSSGQLSDRIRTSQIILVQIISLLSSKNTIRHYES